MAARAGGGVACVVYDGNWACLVRRLVGKGIQVACAPMAERWAGASWSSRSTRSTRSGSLTLACDSVLALRKRRGAYGCHLPTRGGPPTCAGLLLAWWGVGGAVGGDGRFAAPGGCRLSAAEGRKKSLAGQATLGACGASFWGSRGYSHSSI